MYDLHLNDFIVYRWDDQPLPHDQIVFFGSKLGVGVSYTHHFEEGFTMDFNVNSFSSCIND